MRSTRTRTVLVAGLTAAISLLVFVAPAGAANPIPAGGAAIEHASLDWTGNQLLQGESESHVGVNFFSAGVSDGTEATYSAQSGNVSIYNVNASGEETLATWATRGEHTATGSEQLVRLAEGVGRIEADGSAKVDWTGSFSVNFYAGLVPFTITDPELVVTADGSGELAGTISGCEASMGGPGCIPLASAQVTVATFSGAHVNPEEVLAVTPDYAGVEVETTGAPTPQNRSVAGWGSWPQSFVDYQIETGLSSYWYSSGHNDTRKAPLPFTVDFKGTIPTANTDTGTTGSPSGTSTPTPPATTPSGKPRVAALGGIRKIDSSGAVELARLSCPSGGSACKAVVPKHLGVRIGGKRYLLRVVAPKKVGAGKSATLRVRLSKAARQALGDGKLVLTLHVTLRVDGSATAQVVKVTIAGRH
ncbi:MAG TPA: hypothetical protein VHV53_02250 [Solirubrobacterales bacterium]|nr:hypothetical protein [Solirubrobacterales bacterium]